MAKDVHTEHCCIIHGCKYGNDREKFKGTPEECTVTSKRQPQSYPCEDCEHDGIDPTKMDMTTNIFHFKKGCYYKTVAVPGAQPTLMFVMGFKNDVKGVRNAICDLFMFSIPIVKYIHSIQGTSKIMVAQWEEITKEQYNDWEDKLTKHPLGEMDKENGTGSVS